MRLASGLMIAVLVGCSGESEENVETVESCVPTAQTDLEWTAAWSASYGGPKGDFVGAVLARDGFVDVVGHFAGVSDFDPTDDLFEAEASLPPEEDTGTYVSRFARDGTYQWTAAFRGTRQGVGSLYYLDRMGDGSVLVGGKLGRTADFDPGPGEDLRDPDEEHHGGFVTRLSPAGLPVWTRTEELSQIPFVASLGDGRVLTVASGTGRILDPETGATAEELGFLASFVDLDLLRDDVVVGVTTVGTTLPRLIAVRFDGELLYEVPLGYAEIYDVRVVDGDVLVVGDTTGSLEEWYFQPIGHRDGFAMRFDADGNRKWVQTWGGIGHDRVRTVAPGPDGTVFVGGSFYQDLFYDNKGSSLVARGLDAYLIQLDADGEVLGARSWGADGDDETFALDFDGALWMAGVFDDVIDPSTSGTQPRESAGYTDALLVRFEPGTEPIGASCGQVDECNESSSSRLTGTVLPKAYSDCAEQGFGTYNRSDGTSVCVYFVAESDDAEAFAQCKQAGGGIIELEPGQGCDVIYAQCGAPCFGNFCD